VDSPKIITPIRRRPNAGLIQTIISWASPQWNAKPRPAAIKKHRAFLAMSFAVNSLLLASVLLAAYGAVWSIPRGAI